MLRDSEDVWSARGDTGVGRWHWKDKRKMSCLVTWRGRGQKCHTRTMLSPWLVCGLEQAALLSPCPATIHRSEGRMPCGLAAPIFARSTSTATPQRPVWPHHPAPAVAESSSACISTTRQNDPNSTSCRAMRAAALSSRAPNWRSGEPALQHA